MAAQAGVPAGAWPEWLPGRGWRPESEELRSELPLRCLEGPDMRGSQTITDLMNEVLTHEFTALNQYFLRDRMCEHE
jgi:hypothetical protein